MTDGTIINTNNLWIITIDKEGRKNHIDWSDKYAKIREVLGASRPVREWKVPLGRHWYTPVPMGRD